MPACLKRQCIKPSKTCESGGIGRRTGFRFQRCKAWEFESLLSHQINRLEVHAYWVSSLFSWYFVRNDFLHFTRVSKVSLFSFLTNSWQNSWQVTGGHYGSHLFPYGDPRIANTEESILMVEWCAIFFAIMSLMHLVKIVYILMIFVVWWLH